MLLVGGVNTVDIDMTKDGFHLHPIYLSIDTYLKSFNIN